MTCNKISFGKIKWLWAKIGATRPQLIYSVCQVSKIGRLAPIRLVCVNTSNKFKLQIWCWHSTDFNSHIKNNFSFPRTSHICSNKPLVKPYRQGRRPTTSAARDSGSQHRGKRRSIRFLCHSMDSQKRKQSKALWKEKQNFRWTCGLACLYFIQNRNVQQELSILWQPPASVREHLPGATNKTHNALWNHM